MKLTDHAIIYKCYKRYKDVISMINVVLTMTRIAVFLILCVSFGEKNAVSGIELTEISSFVNNFEQNANLFKNGTLLYEDVRFPIDFGNPGKLYL